MFCKSFWGIVFKSQVHVSYHFYCLDEFQLYEQKTTGDKPGVGRLINFWLNIYCFCSFVNRQILQQYNDAFVFPSTLYGTNFYKFGKIHRIQVAISTDHSTYFLNLIVINVEGHPKIRSSLVNVHPEFKPWYYS